MTGKRVGGSGERFESALLYKTIVDVVEDGDDITLRFADGSWAYGRVVVDDVGMSLAVIDWDAEPHHVSLHGAGIIGDDEYRARVDAGRGDQKLSR